MTTASAALRLMKTAEENAETSGEPSLTSVVGTGPDDGRLAHRATHGATQGVTRGAPDAKRRQETENELVGFVCDLLQASDSAVGTISGGLDESALMVVRAARDARPHLRRPTVVLPQPAHPAWFAAAAAVGVSTTVAPVADDGSLQVGPMTPLIRDQTVLVVASAPSYTHGRVDPVGWIAAACTAHAVPLHVDASSGGWALAYAELAGRVRQPWGFAVPGVSSITLDVGPDRGVAADVSVLIHRDPAGRRAVHAAALASRGPLDTGVAWSASTSTLSEVNETLREVGHLQCAKLALDALDATAELVTGLLDSRGITVAAQPDATTLVLRADATCDAFVFADALHQRGWTAQPFFPDQGPPMLRFAVTAAMLPLVPQCLAAMDDAVSEARARGRAQVDPTLERLLEKLDPQDVSVYAAELLLDAAAVLDESDPDQPERSQATNLLLKAAPPEIRELLLTYQRDRLSRPVRKGSPILTFAPAADGA